MREHTDVFRLYTVDQCISNNALAALRIANIDPDELEKELGIAPMFGFPCKIPDDVLKVVAKRTGISYGTLIDEWWSEDLLEYGKISFCDLGRERENV